jgi:cytochrome c553
MWGAVQRVNPDVARVVAAYLASLEARPADDGYPNMQSEGRSLYVNGDPATNVPACAVCHGPNAEGAAAIPRLGGLSYRYLQRRLEEWGEGYHASAAFPMKAVATQLSDRQIEAIASYLSFAR